MAPKFVTVLFITCLPAIPITAADTSPLKASELKVCREMVDRSCRGEASRFSSDTGTVAFLTRIEGATGDAFVEHVWRLDGKIVRRARVAIRPGSYRAWSTKRIAAQPGQWRVEVLDPVGRRLGSLDFTVEPEGEAGRE